MTPQEFISKWNAVELKERSASQSHFNDICRLLGVDDPITADKTGDTFCFEKGASKTSGGEGWADVWKRDCFAWEYKGKKKDLDKAFDQLLQYAIALQNPPLLIVSDMDRIRIHTNWTNTVQQVHEIALTDLMDGAKRDLLRNCFVNPEKLKPQKTRQVLTEEAAQRFALIAQRLRSRGHDAHVVAHFVNRLVFCMFAEDVNLLPNKMFEQMISASRKHPDTFASHAKTLFRAMRTGGNVGFEPVERFNGGLFDTDEALPLAWEDLDDLIRATQLDWSDIDPSILGTLFERGLDPDKRSQLGAHYTDRDKIMQIVKPVVVQPLLAEWAAIRDEMAALIDAAPVATKDKLLVGASLAARTRAYKKAEVLHRAFLARLKNYRVLDPACGSGNFLYIALTELKNIEHRANLEAEALGLQRPALLGVGPENVLGIELNPYAAELARVSVWIGDIQWTRRNGFEVARNPILRTLTTIQTRNAIINTDGSAVVWPTAEAIVGNPPYLGAKLMKRKLGVDETNAIRELYAKRLPGFTDLVCYWFENARDMIDNGRAKRAGFVATNSIRKNTNLPVVKRIVATTRIFNAWPEEKWTIDGAAVDVSLICFGESDGLTFLNGNVVEHINADITTGLDLTKAGALQENNDGAFLGIQKSGPFDVPGTIARDWLQEPFNPNGRPNSDVLRPYWNGDDVTGVPRDMWLIDLPIGSTEATAAQFASPFKHLTNTPDADGKTVRQLRAELGERAGPRWWEPHWPRPEMRSRIAGVKRYIVTPETAQHRLFVWLQLPVLPDKNLIVIPRDDDTTFGILHSRIHEIWALRKGSDLQDRPRYTHTSTFATFPFPEGLTPKVPAAEYASNPIAAKIANVAAILNQLRENWLNPSDFVDRVPEVVPGYPDRLLPKNAAAAAELKKRTMTNLYNTRPAWLDHAHKAVDEAVAEAYGWGDDWRAGTLTDDEILARLFRLNQERSTTGERNER